MEFKLKAISPEGIEAALSKAEVYRFLNEPEEAESICQDVLAVQPGHQLALRLLGLALTDQFTGGTGDRYSDAVNAFQQLTDAYEQFYYTGLLYERRAKAHLHRSALGAAEVAVEWFHEAMTWYERAERLRPTGNDEAILRWNTCVRLLGRHAPSGHPRHRSGRVPPSSGASDQLTSPPPSTHRPRVRPLVVFKSSPAGARQPTLGARKSSERGAW